MTQEQQDKLEDLLEEMGLTHERYNGKIVLNYQHGRIIYYGREETLKLTEKRR